MPRKSSVKLDTKGVYLSAAEEVLRLLQRPATVLEIESAIRRNFPELLRGKTPYKTIQARIATDIKHHPNGSRFFRAGPATFGLRELAERPNYFRGVTTYYHGFDRRKQLDRSPRLAIEKSKTEFTPSLGFTDSAIFPLRALTYMPIRLVSPEEIEIGDYYSVITFIVVRHKDSIISFMPSSYDHNYKKIESDESIGISGVIKSDDRNLFDLKNHGYASAVYREYYEFYKNVSSRAADLVDDIKYSGIVYENYTKKRSKSLGLVSIVNLKEKFDVESHRLGSRNLGWRSLVGYPNNIEKFDPWSYFVFLHLHETEYGK